MQLLDEKEESSPLTYEETEFNGDNPEKSEKRKLLESWLNKS